MFKVKPNDDKTLEWWYQNRHKIDMEPTYQRHGSLWGKEKKGRLIDSILNDYDMPKIYLADFNYLKTKLNEKSKPFAVIDGKQRLETIFEFFEGKLELPADFKYLPEPALKLAGMNYRDMKRHHPKIAGKIEQHIPSVMSVVGDDEDRIDELFVRLNSGLAINSAEKRNAMPGIVPQLIRHLVARPFFKENIRFDISRMADYSVAAKLLVIEFNKGFVDTKAKTLDAFVKSGIKLNGNKPHFSSAADQVGETADLMATIFVKRDPLLSTAGHIPIFYWLVRNHHRKTEVEAMRPFLEKFLKKFNETKRLINQRAQNIDQEFLIYYNRHRTNNDQSSLKDRYKTIEDHFAAFLKSRSE